MVSDRDLSKYNIKFIKYSLYLSLFGVITFLLNIIFYPIVHKAIIIGVSIGILWGLLMPKIWKKESETLNVIVIFLTIPLSGSLYDNHGLFAGFQMFSILFLISGVFWYLQKDRLIKYLSE
jgi:hypothetical protein